MDGTSGLPRVKRLTLAAVAGVMLALLAPGALSLAWGTETGDTGNGGGTTDPGGSETGTPGGGGTTTPTYYYRSTIDSPDYAAYFCDATDGRGQPLVGRKASYRYPSTMTWAQAWAEIQLGINNYSKFDISSTWRCLYPPSYRDVQIRVVLSSEVTIERVRPDTEVLANIKMTSDWQDGDHSISGAYASDSLYAAADVDLNDYGRYQASGTTKSRYVTARLWNSHTDDAGNRYTDSIISVGPVFTADNRTARAEITCEGYRNGWSGTSWSYTHTDCGPTGNSTETPEYQCVAEGDDPAIRINAAPTRSATLPRDGNAVPVEFDLVRPEGNFTANGTVTTMFNRAGGSPWDTNGVRTPSEAMFALVDDPTSTRTLLTSDTFTPRLSGARELVYAKAWWASDQGDPTRFRSMWNFVGTSEVSTVEITGVASDGTWTTRTRTTEVESTAMCASPFAELTYVRAVSGPGR